MKACSCCWGAGSGLQRGSQPRGDSLGSREAPSAPRLGSCCLCAPSRRSVTPHAMPSGVGCFLAIVWRKSECANQPCLMPAVMSWGWVVVCCWAHFAVSSSAAWLEASTLGDPSWHGVPGAAPLWLYAPKKNSLLLPAVLITLLNAPHRTPVGACCCC